MHVFHTQLLCLQLQTGTITGLMHVFSHTAACLAVAEWHRYMLDAYLQGLPLQGGGFAASTSCCTAGL